MKHRALFHLAAAIAFFVTAGTATCIAASQESSSREKTARPSMEVLKEKLELTTSQLAAIASIIKRERAAARELRQSNGPRFQKVLRLRRIREAANREIRAILNPEQREKFDDLLAATDEKIRKRMKDKRISY